jgi:hypothetical protein
MNLLLAASIALGCAFFGWVLGWLFSRLRGPYWAIGYFIPLILVFVYVLGFRFPNLVFVPPCSWVMMGIKKFALFSFVTTFVLTTPLSRIPGKSSRTAISALMVVIVFFMAVWPFLAPLADRNQLNRLKTNVDQDGICLQSTDYTCGPAAAVTALRKLGLPADEGQIAILSYTSFQEGTPTDMLADALQNQYAKDGLVVKYRSFKSIAELKQAGLTLAVIKYGFMVDHWVTVLAVTDKEVIIGDPLAGLAHLSYQEFAGKWRFIGIVLQRKADS